MTLVSIDPPPALPPDVARHMAAFALTQDWPVRRLLATAGVDADALLEGRLGLTERQTVTVVRGLWKHTDDELLGLGSERLPRGSFRLLCYGLIGAPDLGAALRRACSLLGALPALSVRVQVERPLGRVRVEVPHRKRPNDPGDVLLLSSLLVVHRLVTWAVGGIPPGAQVEVPYARTADTTRADELFGVPVRHNVRRPALGMDLTALALPIVRREKDLEQLVAGAPHTLLRLAPSDDSTESRVRRQLEVAVRCGEWPHADQVARRLAVSGQTLRRRLQEEGTSFRAIVDQARHEAALASLDLGRESIADLASRLGYSEASAFTRAFQRWTGHTPAVHRQHPDGARGCRVGA